MDEREGDKPNPDLKPEAKPRAKRKPNTIKRSKTSKLPSGKGADIKIRVSRATYTAISEYAKAYGMSHDTTVWQLVEFYRLNNLLLLIQFIRSKYMAGLTIFELNELSILYTLLGEIDKFSGL